jgi:ferric-dicitrate binding protein FerR (iron transport regulator)
MKEQIDYKILKNFAGGKYSLRDFRLVSRWFDDDSNEAELKNAIRLHWIEFSAEAADNEKDLSTVLSQLKQKIAAEKPVANFRARIQNFYMRAAAILLLPLFLYSVYSTFFDVPAITNTSTVEIYSPQGARTRFELPDGSQGWLNSGSHLKYATNFRDNRNVKLVGEAWFEVAHDKKKPFVVSTPSLDVQVLGTKFNVTAFPDEKVTEVVLQEGKVNVTGTKGSFTTEMNPDEKFTYNSELNTSTVQSVNADQFSAWKDGLLVFRNEPLSEVLKRIGRWYNVEIKLNDPELAKFRYRATFREEQVEEVIRLISLTAPIEYTFDSRKVNDSGVFLKRTVTISRKRN